MRVGLVARFNVGIILVLSVALGLVSYLNYAKFRQTLVDLEASQFKAIGAELVAVFENNLNLGLSLHEIDNLEQILEFGHRQDPAIRSVEILNVDEEPLASTSNLAGFEEHGASSEESDNHFSVALPITNSFGEQAGQLSINYDRRMFDLSMSSVWTVLKQALWSAWTVCILLVVPLVWLFFQPFWRRVSRLADELSNDRQDTVDPSQAARECSQQLNLAVRRVRIRLVVTALTLLVAATAWISFKALTEFERSMQEPVERKSVAIASVVGTSLKRAIELGVPLRSLVGVPDYLKLVQSEQPEVAAITISDNTGNVLYAVGRADSEQGKQNPNVFEGTYWAGISTNSGQAQFKTVEHIVTVAGQKNSTVEVVVDTQYFQNALSEVLYDILVVLGVSLLIAIEVLTLITTRTIIEPIARLISALRQMRQAQGINLDTSSLTGELAKLGNAIRVLQNRVQPRLENDAGKSDQTQETNPRHFSLQQNDDRRRSSAQAVPSSLVLMRMPLFLFMFAEELSRSFLPLYASSMSLPSIDVDPNIMIGLPITVFMIVVAISTPISGWLIDRFGVRQLLLAGMLPGVVGFIGTSQAETLVELVAWRAVTAIAYAVMFIGAQSYIAKNSTERERTRAMALFVGAIITAGVCGMSVGGILAEHIGYRETFTLSAVLVCISAFMVLRYVPGTEIKPSSTTSTTEADVESNDESSERSVPNWRNPRLAALLLFAAIPGKLLLTGYLFFLVPVLLAEMGASNATIGRVMMIYGIVVLAMTPLIAKLSDYLRRPELLIALGGLVAGMGPLLAFSVVGLEAALLGVLLLGLGHALSSAPQLALVPELKNSAGTGSLAGMLAYYRLIERAGAVAGPLVAALLVAEFGLQAASGWLGVGALCAALAFALFFMFAGVPRPSKRLEVEFQS